MVSEFISRIWTPSQRFVDMLSDAWEVMEKIVRHKDHFKCVESNPIIKCTKLFKNSWKKYLAIG